jgi:hypothetical protein
MAKSKRPKNAPKWQRKLTIDLWRHLQDWTVPDGVRPTLGTFARNRVKQREMVRRLISKCGVVDVDFKGDLYDLCADCYHIEAHLITGGWLSSEQVGAKEGDNS